MIYLPVYFIRGTRISYSSVISMHSWITWSLTSLLRCTRSKANDGMHVELTVHFPMAYRHPSNASPSNASPSNASPSISGIALSLALEPRPAILWPRGNPYFMGRDSTRFILAGTNHSFQHDWLLSCTNDFFNVSFGANATGVRSSSIFAVVPIIVPLWTKIPFGGSNKARKAQIELN